MEALARATAASATRPSATSAKILEKYCSLMEELKTRHAVVQKVLTDAKEGRAVLSPYILGELCFLQLRMMCELIALGCLLVHGDVPATRTNRMQKAHAADWIINRLSELHPSFYPLPGIQVHDAAGHVVSVEPNSKPYLTKADLMRLYAECGGFLHRGTLKDILRANTKPMNLARIGEWSAKITQLLNHHQIPLVGDQHQIWVIMQEKSGGGVRAHPMLRVPETR
jgi:hypothetical protein